MISCKICSNIYTRIDGIVATNCGHIFHKQCLTQLNRERWFSAFRTQECPQCRAEIKTLTGIQPNFEAEFSDKDVQITELKSTISHLYLSSQRLQEQLKNTESKLHDVRAERDIKQRQLLDWQQKMFIADQKVSTLTKEITSKTNEIQKLSSEKNIFIANCNSLRTQLAASEKKFANIQAQYNKNEKELNRATKQIEDLTTKQKNLRKEIHNKIQKQDQLTVEKNKLQEKCINLEQELKQTENEIKNLKTIYKSEDSHISLMAFEEKIKVLTEKNTQISLELSKEIRHSTTLEVEKVKLENLLKQKYSKQQEDKELQENEISNANISNPCNVAASSEISTAKVNANTKATNHSNNILVIRNVNDTFTDEKSLKGYVLKLSNLMNLSFVEDNIVEVSYIRDRRKNKKHLLVNFQSLDLKKKFLTNKYKLKQNPETHKLYFDEQYRNNSVASELYNYAKSLENLGFKEVFRQNNNIFVKNANGSAPIKINNRNDVDKLKNEAKNAKIVKAQVSN